MPPLGGGLEIIMKKNIAKLIAALLCLTVLCGAFAGCGKKNDKTSDDNTPSSAEPSENGIWLPFVENK